MSGTAASAPGSTQSITLTRALVRLKTLDKKLQAAIDGAEFISVTGELSKPKTEATHAAQTYHSITDMVAFRRALKSAVITSNAMTVVTVAGKKCTVAEAIEEKKSIKHKKNLLTRMRKQYADALRTMEEHNSVMRSNLEREQQKKQQADRSGGNATSDDAFTADYSRSYMKMHGIELYDPLDLRTKIQELDDYITNFMDDVDQVLSESNANTIIVVPA